MNTKGKFSYKRGYDGLRFFAILAIILYHYVPYRISGGFLGVDAFLVLSGFLAGTSLMNTKKGKDFSYFSYLYKRFIRLTVPMFGMFIFSVAFFTLFGEKFLFNVKTAIWSSFLYVNNYVQIFEGSSYFANFVNPSPYVHLWYLGVQMQLYIVVPILFFLGRKLLVNNRSLAGLFIIFAMISAILMAVLLPVGGDPSKVYYATHTRAFSFFIGIAASLLMPSLRPILGRRTKGMGLKLILFVISLIGMVTLVFKLEAMSTFTYRGGLILFDLFVVIFIILIAFMPPLNKIVGILPFAILGKISFSVYLWYYPVYSYFNFGPFASSWIGVNWPAQLGILFIISLLSYLFFEAFLTKFILSGKMRTFIRDFKVSSLKENLQKLVSTVMVAVILLISVTGALAAPSGKNETVAELEARLAEEQRKVAEAKLQEQLDAGKEIPDVPGLDRAVMLYAREQQMTFVGDSILLSASSAIANVFPNANIDGAVGRQLYNSDVVVKNLESQGKLANLVVVILGTNGSFTEKQLKQFVETFGKERQLVFLTTFVPRAWQDNVNNALKKLAKENKQVILFDWYSHINGHPDWLAQDGVHLNDTGAAQLANFIAINLYATFDTTHKDLEVANNKAKEANTALENSKVAVGSTETTTDTTDATETSDTTDNSASVG